MRKALEELYAGFNHPESALDPIQIVRRYDRVEDREVVAFVTAGLAFGRVASVIASAEAVCAALGPAPGRFVRAFDPRRDAAPIARLGHRWTRGIDLVGVIWILRELIARHGSLEAALAGGIDSGHVDVGPAIERFGAQARAVDLAPVYGQVPAQPGAHYFFARRSTGSACKRINLFLRWMTRCDGVDPGGWTAVHPRQLIVPLDTHTIRVGRCLRFTRRATPGWGMAADITAALRKFDPEDPVRYDFSLCHLSMMGACGYATKQRDQHCPLRGHCRPRAITTRRQPTMKGHEGP